MKKDSKHGRVHVFRQLQIVVHRLTISYIMSSAEMLRFSVIYHVFAHSKAYMTFYKVDWEQVNL